MTPDDVLDFWFGDADKPQVRADLWFLRGADFDDVIRERFGATLEAAREGKLDAWKPTPRGMLALIIVLDQFSRHLHRGTGRAFENDAQALALAKEALARGDDGALPLVQRFFLLMPLEHSEVLEDQEESVRRFEALRDEAPDDLREMAESFADYARRHRDVVRRFGRFPHRNDRLGRESSPEERDFLLQPGASFG